MAILLRQFNISAENNGEMLISKKTIIELCSKGKISSKNDHFWKKQNERKLCNAL
jgi:hypothetical protein